MVTSNNLESRRTLSVTMDTKTSLVSHGTDGVESPAGGAAAGGGGGGSGVASTAAAQSLYLLCPAFAKGGALVDGVGAPLRPLSVLRHQGVDPGKVTLYPKTAVFICTLLPNGEFALVLARKCMGPSPCGKYPGERDKMRVPAYWQTKQGKPWSRHTGGAAGTAKRYWGKWCSFGGTNSNEADSNLTAGLIEVRDEAAVEITVTRRLYFVHSFVAPETMCYIAYCPPEHIGGFKHLDKGPHRQLIVASHGEIAELRLVPRSKMLDRSVLRNGVADYVEDSFVRVVNPFLIELERLGKDDA